MKLPSGAILLTPPKVSKMLEIRYEAFPSGPLLSLFNSWSTWLRCLKFILSIAYKSYFKFALMVALEYQKALLHWVLRSNSQTQLSDPGQSCPSCYTTSHKCKVCQYLLHVFVSVLLVLGQGHSYYFLEKICIADCDTTFHICLLQQYLGQVCDPEFRVMPKVTVYKFTL